MMFRVGLRKATATESMIGPRSGPHVLLVVENVALARDHRLQKQGTTLARNGYRVSVICRADPGNRRYPGLRVYDYRPPVDGTSTLGYVREYVYSWLMAAYLTVKVFRNEPFDAIQVAGPPDIYFALAAPFKLLGRRLVVDQKDLSPELYEVRYGRRTGVLYRTLCWLERRSHQVADRVITANETFASLLNARGELPAGKVSVVGNGPILSEMQVMPPRPDLKQGRRFLCCWVGFMGPQDRVDIAVRAVDHLVNALGRRDCHFAFLGDGEERAACEKLAKELGIGDWVTFTGWVERPTVCAYLSSADLCLESNLEDIIAPVKVMEYMVFGLPFVSFDLRETRAMAGDAAAYAEPGDVAGLARQIERLLDDPLRRVEMGRMGRLQVEQRLAWDRQQSAYLEVYQGLLDGPNLRRGSTRRDASGSVSIVTRARNRLRTRVSESPALYLPLARHKYPGPSPEVINSETELVIDAYTRAATTFAVYAFQLSQETPVRLAHHLHAAAQVIDAARRKVPTLVLIREPQGTILSQLAREPWVTMADALRAYSRYYTCLLRYRNSYVIGEFEQVTRDFGAVIRRLNARFGTSFAEFVHNEDNLRECLQFVALRGTLPRHMLGFESGTVTKDQLRQYVKSHALQPRQHGEEWIPAENRERGKAALLEQWAQPSLARLRQRAQLIYETFAGDDAAQRYSGKATRNEQEAQGVREVMGR
jgi:glycosyltransferase involved in cell wall biosynthesis